MGKLEFHKIVNESGERNKQLRFGLEKQRHYGEIEVSSNINIDYIIIWIINKIWFIKVANINQTNYNCQKSIHNQF